MGDLQTNIKGQKIIESLNNGLEVPQLKKDLTELSLKVDELLEQGVDPEDIKAAIDKYLEQHPIGEGLATEEWVENKGYLTAHQDISGKADKAVVVSNSNAAVSVNVGSYTKDTIIKCGTITSLALTNVTDNAVEVSVIFSVGDSAENILSIPIGTKVVGEINIEANKTYALSVLGGAVVCGTINLSE